MSGRANIGDLTPAQQYALLDVVARGGINRIRPGYDGTIVHRHNTMIALTVKGLVALRPGGCQGWAEPTKLGTRTCGGKRAAYQAVVRLRDATRGRT